MLQRSVTETRRLASGRPNVSRSTSDMGGSRGGTTGRVDPHFAAVRAQPFLPHGHAPLHLFDYVATRLERLRPVRRRRDDRDARLVHRDPPQPVPHGDPGAGPALPDLRDDATQLPVDHLLVGGVLDRGHAVLLRAVAHGPEKRARAAALGGGDLGEQGIEGNVRADEIGHGLSRAIIHPPAIGGKSATSSPSRTLASSFTCFKFTAARGRSGNPRPPGSSSRTRRTTSPTVAGSGTATAASPPPTSSA